MNPWIPSCFAMALSLTALAVSAQDADADPDFGDRLATCAACHGERGEGADGSAYAPHLAGKPGAYLYEQLRGFRDGGRQHLQMAWLVRHLDDDYLREIGDWYAALPPKTAPADELAAREARPDDAIAKRLVEQGDPARGLHACASCHGADLVGLEPGVPALVGLPAEYVVAQFGAWRTGVRSASAPDCMADIARTLEPTEIRAIAEWLSRQGHSQPRRPAAAGSFALPEACGSNPVGSESARARFETAAFADALGSSVSVPTQGRGEAQDSAAPVEAQSSGHATEAPRAPISSPPRRRGPSAESARADTSAQRTCDHSSGCDVDVADQSKANPE